MSANTSFSIHLPYVTTLDTEGIQTELEFESDGTFLISQQTNTLYYHNDGEVHSVPIIRRNNKVMLESGREFGSLEALVHHHTMHKDSNLLCRLEYPDGFEPDVTISGASSTDEFDEDEILKRNDELQRESTQLRQDLHDLQQYNKVLENFQIKCKKGECEHGLRVTSLTRRLNEPIASEEGGPEGPKMAGIEAKCEAMASIIEQLEQQLNEKTENHMVRGQKLGHFEKECEALKSICEQREAELEALKKHGGDSAALTKEIERLTALTNQMTEENEVLKRNLADCAAKLGGLDGQCGAMKSIIEQHEATNDQLKQMNTILNTQVIELEQENANLDSYIEELRIKLDELAKLINEGEDRNTQLQEDLNECLAELSSTHDRLRTVTEELDTLKIMYEKVVFDLTCGATKIRDGRDVVCPQPLPGPSEPRPQPGGGCVWPSSSDTESTVSNDKCRSRNNRCSCRCCKQSQGRHPHRGHHNNHQRSITGGASEAQLIDQPIIVERRGGAQRAESCGYSVENCNYIGPDRGSHRRHREAAEDVVYVSEDRAAQRLRAANEQLSQRNTPHHQQQREQQVQQTASSSEIQPFSSAFAQRQMVQKQQWAQPQHGKGGAMYFPVEVMEGVDSCRLSIVGNGWIRVSGVDVSLLDHRQNYDVTFPLVHVDRYAKSSNVFILSVGRVNELGPAVFEIYSAFTNFVYEEFERCLASM